MVYMKAGAAERAKLFRKKHRPEAIRELHEEIETDGLDTTSASSNASASDAPPVLSRRDTGNPQRSMPPAILTGRTRGANKQFLQRGDLLMMTVGDGTVDEYEDVEGVSCYAQEKSDPVE